MLYKNDWEQAKKRLMAWWDGELLDRCCASVIASAPVPTKNSYKIGLPDDREGKIKYWTDPEWVIKRQRDAMEQTWFGGEAFPLANLDLGAAGHAGFFKGAKHSFEDSVWFFPSLTDFEDMEFDENSFLYQKTLELAKAMADDSKGDYMIAQSDCTGNADALSHLIGADELLPLMLEEPEVVQKAMKKAQYAYEMVHKNVYDIVKENNEGGSCVGWLRTWAPGFHAQMQSDMSVMISAGMFKEFIEPELRAQCDFLDYPLYHFDGIEQIRHLDSLLSIEKLRVIQWTQVVGHPPCTEYIPELKQIQKAGKNLLIHVTPDQIRPLMENLSSKGLYLLVSASDREEGEAILKEIAKYTHE